MSETRLREFVAESNRIEGIVREPTVQEVGMHEFFLALPSIGVVDMEAFVAQVAHAELRRREGMDVRVGHHVPMRGGPNVEKILSFLLADLHKLSPFQAHQRYEEIHPFMDGNGRSGRALWAWHMKADGQDPFALPFLHRWYYQSLDAQRSQP